MILRLIKKSNLGQTERSYARAVMEYIATPEVALLNESGHKKGIVEKCSHYAVHGCTPGLDLRHQAKEFGMIAESADCRAQHVLRHYVLSWPSGEHPTPTQAEDAAKIFLNGLGYNTASAMWMVGLHVNTEHYHVHIFANRQNPDTSVLVNEGNGWWVKEGQRLISKIEYQQGWKTDPRAMYKWNPHTHVAEKTRKARNKFDYVTAIPRGVELRTGKMSEERLIKQATKRILQELAAMPESQRTWAQAHRVFAAYGLEYIKNEKGCVISLDSIRHYPTSKVADEISLSSLEHLIGSTFRKPRKREQAELEQIRSERRKLIASQPHPLPPTLMSAKHRAAYMAEYGLARGKWRLQEQRLRHLELTARARRAQQALYQANQQ